MLRLFFIFIFLVSTPIKADGINIQFTMGGIIRTPNNLQPEESGNLFGEAWFKADTTLARFGKMDFKAFIQGNYLRDSKPFSWNNKAKFGAGLTLGGNITDNLYLGFTLRHDKARELTTGVKESNTEFVANYYFYKEWNSPYLTQMFGRSFSKVVLKSWGDVKTPGSSIPGDVNVVFSTGGELGIELDVKNTPLVIIPHFSWDLLADTEKYTYNNKIVPELGVKIRYPLESGEIFAGLKRGVDIRTVVDSTNTGSTVFFGWYKAF